jgi:6-phosphogluconolactonase (cycloisomerase 2 family)
MQATTSDTETQLMRRNSLFSFLTLAALVAAACDRGPAAPSAPLDFAASGGPADGPGSVYLMTNAPDGNAVIVFDRAADGQLTPAGTFATGGAGTGGGLGNQASLVLSDDGRYLFAVNAGSNDISVFAVQDGAVQLVTPPVASGGTRPISLTVHGDLLYVLNAGGDGNITGFRIEQGAGLVPIAGSSRPLSSAAADPAQVKFSPDGRVLVVSEKATSVLSTYIVGADGRADGPVVNQSAGETPFGFNFNQRGDLVVSEAAGGAPGAATASSYRVGGAGILTPISGPVATQQSAACWIAISADGRFAYTANTGSGTLSSLAIQPGAVITLAEAVAAETGPGSAPADAAFSAGGRFVYVRNGAGFVSGFRLEDNGRLTPVGDFGGLPPGANGLAAR